MASMKIEFVGHYSDKTVTINGFNIVDGVLELTGELKSMDGVIAYFRTFGGYLSGSDDLAKARESLGKETQNGNSQVLDGAGKPEGGVQTNVPTGSTSGGAGTANSGTTQSGPSEPANGNGVSKGHMESGGQSSDPQMLKITDALKALDPTADNHWTDAGLPRVDAVATATGIATVTRKDIETAIPGWNREAALAAI